MIYVYFNGRRSFLQMDIITTWIEYWPLVNHLVLQASKILGLLTIILKLSSPSILQYVAIETKKCAFFIYNSWGPLTVNKNNFLISYECNSHPGYFLLHFQPYSEGNNRNKMLLSNMFEFERNNQNHMKCNF